VEHVVLGTAAVRDQEWVAEAARRHPGRIVVALDARGGLVATGGWLETSETRAIDVAARLAALPLAALLYTDIERDGTEVGPNIAATRALAEATPIPVIASGGVGTLEHLAELARSSPKQGGGIAGAIVGRALHEGRFTLQAAIEHVARAV
jgi:phosphoribosylformimino-5-aminoimidazole carboxamide ribotide isomerase